MVAESIFWVMEVETSTGLPMRLGSAGMSRAPLPAGGSILSCLWPCVCSEAMSSCLCTVLNALAVVLFLLLKFRANQGGEVFLSESSRKVDERMRGGWCV